MYKVIIIHNNEHDSPLPQGQTIPLYENSDQFTIEKIICRKNKTSSHVDNAIFFDRFILSRIISYFVLLKILIINIYRNHSNTIFHVRGYVSAFVFYFAKIILFKKVKYVYDPRGWFPKELEERSSFPWFVYKFLRCIEKRIIRDSLLTIVTSKAYYKLMVETYGYEEKYHVIYNNAVGNFVTKDPPNHSEVLNFCYVGSLNYWHPLNEIVELIVALNSSLSSSHPAMRSRFYFCTSISNHEKIKSALAPYRQIECIVKDIQYKDLRDFYTDMHIGISVVRPTISTSIASPIKISEYLAHGLRVVCNYGIGDFDDKLISSRIGLLYKFGTYNVNIENFISSNNKVSPTDFILLSRDYSVNKFHQKLISIILC